MATGGGHSNLKETLSIVGVPVMSKTSFISTERNIGMWWEQELQRLMVEAGKEERDLAIGRGEYNEGVPAITVIVDGGWSKRSHRHSYNANLGVGIIIGKATGKLLYIGVRNKYCSACARNISQDKHQCFKNWRASSSEMESDIILEGFLKAEQTHGVRYTKFIGDGDSSVFPTLVQSVPAWGHYIQKLECANHACKCYRSALERLVQDNPSYKGRNGLTAKMRKKLVSSARCAIRMRSQESDKKKALQLLKKDLVNGPRHCFGLHQYCSPDFCTTAMAHKQQQLQIQSSLLSSSNLSTEPAVVQSPIQSSLSPPTEHSIIQPPLRLSLSPPTEQSIIQPQLRSSLSPSTEAAVVQILSTPSSSSEPSPPLENENADALDSLPDDANDITDIVTDQITLWEETTAEDTEIEKEVRQGGLTPTSIDPRLYHDIQVQLTRLVGKAKQLLGNETTNLAESWMNIRAKFDGGKFFNRSQSGSWQHRCMGAGLRHNLGDKWSPEAWRSLTQSSPNKVFCEVVENSAKILEKDRKRKATPEAKERRRQSKYRKTDDNSVAARKAYSRHDDSILPDEIFDDVSPERLEALKSQFYEAKVVICREAAKELQDQTKDQFYSDQWRYERRKRITASNTGGIAKMKVKTKRANKVKQLLYATFKGSRATTYGSEMESVARQEYIKYQQSKGHPDISVEECGLFVSSENNWLAATPDGLVQDPSDETSSCGILEIKNPFTAKDVTLSEACKVSSFCLEENKDTHTFKLKPQHNYYYQIQCQLYCVEVDWCDFVVRTNHTMHIQRVFRDKKWWDIQLEKLKKFYFDALLPELGCPRFRHGGIREPIQH